MSEGTSTPETVSRSSVESFAHDHAAAPDEMTSVVANSADDFVMVKPEWMTMAQWADICAQTNSFHAAAIASSSEDVLPHADWCTDFEALGCNGLSCHQTREQPIVAATGMPKRADESGVPQHSEIRLLIERVLMPEDRHDGLKPGDTHVIQLNVEMAGWNEDHWVGLTVKQARELHTNLEHLVREVETDAYYLRTDFNAVLDYLLGHPAVTA